TFRVLLPATDESADQSDSRPMPSADGTGTTILVAEDEPAVRSLARRILESAGYSVLVAQSGAEALAMADGLAGKPDLLLTGRAMPGMSGKQLAERVRSGRPACRVLYMSGYFDELVAQHTDRTAFIPKPFNRDELLSRVREVLADAAPDAGFAVMA